ncbi:MAG: hypothetical protein JWR60_2937 [Polaromonas sp.]|nr:hypothetical protein [Polaromonas sp.]
MSLTVAGSVFSPSLNEVSAVPQQISILLSLTAAQATALAKLATALDLAALKSMASDDKEAARMHEAMERIIKALRDAGLLAS